MLDFTYVWGVDPAREWKDERAHLHIRREKSYIVEADVSVIPIAARQILGVRADAVHRCPLAPNPA